MKEISRKNKKHSSGLVSNKLHSFILRFIVILDFLQYVSSSTSNVYRNAQRPKGGSERRGRIPLLGHWKSTSFRFLEQGRIPVVDVPRYVLRAHARQLPWHTEDTGCSKRRRRFSGLLCAQCSWLQQCQGIFTSK